MGWQEVEQALEKADSIAFDGCHKIYVLMDEASTAEQFSFGYRADSGEMLLRSEGATTEQMLAKLKEWFDGSCFLRFIQAVKAPGRNPDYTNLIAQGEEEEEA